MCCDLMHVSLFVKYVPFMYSSQGISCLHTPSVPPPLPPPLPPPPPPRSNVGWVCLAYLVVVLDFLWFLLQFKYLDLLLKSKTYKPPLEQQPR